MADGPALVEPPSVLFRVERPEPPLRYSQISAEDTALDNVGNRFDIAGAGVLYAASHTQGALAETSASFRVSASLLETMAHAGAGPNELAIPVLGPEWRAQRVLRLLETRDALPFVDIEDPVTHTYLTSQARAVLLALGVSHLDVAAVRGPSRLLTRGLATWLYQARDSEGAPLYGGIRYVSKLGDYENWAIFDGTEVRVVGHYRITLDDPDLVAVATRHGIPLA
ncbi:hypothetical protein LLS1_38700 [Leifsonia sp. LS1]|uniref:RES domain-containing protein n=1 Tax=Leifsonia sp. LS1 TaxID=2828483 RepID=UPI001CFCA7A7|nr:RES domain-containing protein [Leifsonia sp. LS1]GIT82201.1 hypothetical protein LLS1_38700 [Leifsonia sp. LS1]